MIQRLSITQAQTIMQNNFIGPEQLNKLPMFSGALAFDLEPIPFSEEELLRKKDDYYLIYGVRTLADGKLITIRNMIRVFGKDSECGEPCFYNQDWYENEEFIDRPMKEGWFFIRKNVYEDSRAVQPVDLMKMYSFPSAISCVYAFFVVWLCRDEKLWYHDFVWCEDTDHNGDRIYVGKYNDVDGVNKNGFSIHRHLALRSCYACID